MSSRPPAFTAERLLQVLETLPAVEAYLVGFSGGADSTALLHAMTSIRDRLQVPVSAIHVNHGLHGDADGWQSRCERFCERLGVDLVSMDINPRGNSGKGLEAEARQMRYEAMASRITPGACLLTAHHADDQAETLLLNLLRGSGVDGLAAMPESRPLGNGLLQRPLLGFQGGALREYLHLNGVEWVEDPSNQVLDHDRNFVRHKLVPLLEQRWPGVSKRLLLTRKAMGEARHLLEGLADDYLSEHLADPLVLHVSSRATANPELFKLVVRHWIRRAGMPSIPHYRLETLYEQVCRPGADHAVEIVWEGRSLRWFGHHLWLLGKDPIPSCPHLPWPPGASHLALDTGLGRIGFEDADAGFGGCALSIGNRQSVGDPRIRHGGHHKHLKNVFQETGIPPWLRSSIPLLCLDGELVAVGDWFLADSFANRLSEKGCSLLWQPEHALLRFVQAQQRPG